MASLYKTGVTYITKDYLESVLRSAENNNTLQVKEFKTSHGAGSNDNFTSAVVAVDVDTDTKKYHLICKVLPQSSTMESKGSVFTKEILVYRGVFQDMMEAQGTTTDRISLGIPHFYTQIGDTSNVLMFDNLKTDGYKILERRTGLDRDHTLLVLKEMAKMHALSYVAKKKSGKKIIDMYPYLTDWRSDLLGDRIHELFEFVHEEFKGNVRAAFGGKYAHLADAQEKITINYEDILAAARSDEEWNVFCHGDTWVPNLCFMYNDSGVPTTVKLIDFPNSLYASLTLDLNFFLYTSTTAETRQHMDELLRVYHDTFRQVLDTLHVEFPTFTLENLKSNFKRDMEFGYANVALVLGAMLSADEDMPNINENAEGLHMCDILKNIHVVMNKANRGNVIYETRMIDVVTEYLKEKGLLHA